MKGKYKEPKARVVWGINPVSRVVPSKKVYKRYENKREISKEMNNG